MAERDSVLIDELIQLDRDRPAKVLVIGDFMTDVYVRGVTHTPVQEGCTKFNEADRVAVFGGAGNAMMSLKNWRSETKAVYDERNHPIKTRFMVEDVCVFRHDRDNYDTDLDLIRSEYRRLLYDWFPNAVLLSDYDKGLLTLDFIGEVMEHCAAANIPCVVDCKRPPSVYRPHLGCVLKGNRDYFDRWAEQARRMDTKAVSTNGRWFPIVWDRGVVKSDVIPEPIRCVNHVGAGDCFAAHLTLCLAHGFSLSDASTVAYFAGRQYVQHRNNRPPHPDEIRRDMLRWYEMLRTLENRP